MVFASARKEEEKTVEKMIDKQQNIGIKLTKLQVDAWKQWLKVPCRAEMEKSLPTDLALQLC